MNHNCTWREYRGSFEGRHTFVVSQLQRNHAFTDNGYRYYHTIYSNADLILSLLQTSSTITFQNGQVVDLRTA